MRKYCPNCDTLRSQPVRPDTHVVSPVPAGDEAPYRWIKQLVASEMEDVLEVEASGGFVGEADVERRASSIAVYIVSRLQALGQ